MEDSNIKISKLECVQEQRQVIKQIEEQEVRLSKARKLFVENILEFDDYGKLKKEYHASSKCLKKELENIAIKTRSLGKLLEQGSRSVINVFYEYSNLGTEDRKQFVSLIPPAKLDPQTGDISVDLNSALSKILVLNDIDYGSGSYGEKGFD